MPTTHCQCGAKYRYAESSIGKRARCKKCGAVFTLTPEDDEGVIPLADEHEMRDEMAAAAEQPRATAIPKQGEVFVPTGSPGAAGTHGLGPAAAASGTLPPRSYASDALWTFLFPSSPGNLVTFIVLWGVIVVAPLVSCVPLIGFFLWLLVIAWYCAYRLEIVASAAGGDSDLPDLSGPQHLVDLVDPFFKWVGSWIVVFIPALGYMILTWGQSGITGLDLLPMILGGIAGILSGSTSGAVTFDVLVYLGILFWPMVVLCVAIGGFATLYRLDLILLTIIKTFPYYVLTLILMFGAVFLKLGILELAGGGLATQAQPGRGSPAAMMGIGLVLSILGTGIGIYCDIVLMRLIGLYYYHFKDRFAWSWG